MTTPCFDLNFFKQVYSADLTFAKKSSFFSEKLDFASQMNRIQAIDEIENEAFVPKSFKSSANKNACLGEIPLPPLELKPINFSSLKNEILCHPSVSGSHKLSYY